MKGFDLKAFAGARHSGAIEKGEYPAVIDKMEWTESTAGEMMLVATISILLAHGGKKVVKDYFNLFNKSKKAAEISASRLTDLCGACGLNEPPSEARTFEGMQLWVKVGVDNKGYNVIDRFMYWKPMDNTNLMKENLNRGNSETESSTNTSTQRCSDLEDVYEYLETMVPEEF